MTQICAWFAICALNVCSAVAAGENSAEMTRWRLQNGLDVSIIRIPDEPIFAAFTIFPGGLAADIPGQMLWMQLFERLNTQTFGEHDGMSAGDHTLFDTWSTPEKWQDVLADHARLLKGMDFSQDQVKIFKEHVLIDMRWQKKNRGFAIDPHALLGPALAGVREVNLTRDVQGATLSALKDYSKQKLASLADARLCIIGSVEPDQLRPVIGSLFEPLGEKTEAITTRPTLASPSRCEITWEQPDGYIMLAWTLPPLSPKEKAALYLAQNLLSKADQELQAVSGMKAPAGDLFVAVINDENLSSEKAVKKFQAARSALEHLSPEEWTDTRENLSQHFVLSKIPLVTKPSLYQSGTSFNQWYHYRRYWAVLEWYLGESRAEIGKELSIMTWPELHAVIEKYLNLDSVITCTVQSSKQR